MKISHFMTGACFYWLCIAATPLLAATPSAHITLLQQCAPLPLQATEAQFKSFEQCTKQDGPARIATYFADIYGKKQGKVSLRYLDGTELVLDDFTEDSPEHYQFFSLWGCEASERYCVLHQYGWERWSYLLIDRKTKLTTKLTGYPVFSPDSQFLFEYLDSRISETFNHNLLKVYRLTDAEPQLLLEQNNPDFGVRSAYWLGTHTLQAILQNFAPDDYSRYVEVGTLLLEIRGNQVSISIEKMPPQK